MPMKSKRRSPAVPCGDCADGTSKQFHALGIIGLILAAVLIVAIASNLFLIYRFSAESGEDSSERSAEVTRWLASHLFRDYHDLTDIEKRELHTLMHHYVRKLAHLSEYALLGFLMAGLALLLFGRGKNRRKPGRMLWLTWVIPACLGLGFAMMDEFHQSFTPGRGPSGTDVMIDFAGVVIGMTLIQLIVWLIRLIADGRRKRR